jgi:hypothetical protein
MINAGTTNIIAVELYNDGEIKLEELRVMLGDECIAKSWREYKHGEHKSGAGTLDLSHYTLPLWYQRYKKLNEIL